MKERQCKSVVAPFSKIFGLNSNKSSFLFLDFCTGCSKFWQAWLVNETLLAKG